MPTYEYLCDECGHSAEIIQKISADPIAVCPVCQSQKYHRVIGVTGFILKGSGWYKTDYTSKGAGAGTAPAKPSTSSSADD